MRTRGPSVLGAFVAASAIVLTGCSFGSSATASGSEDVIRFATLPLTDDPTAETPVDVIAALLEAETEYTVEVTDVPNYSAVIEAIRAGHEDIGIMSGFPSALAVNTGEVDSLIAWSGGDDPVSTCLVLDSSPLRTLTDITPDTTVAFADPASSSGYFMPVHMLYEAGLEMGDDYEVLISGGHDRSFLALRNGQADVACTATIFPSLAGRGDPMFPFEVGETRSLGESIPMPVSTSVLANPGMGDAKRQALVEALPKVFSVENKEALGLYGEGIGVGVDPIIEPDASVFQPYVDIAAVAGVDISDLE
ncbi:PhnD/SsuA/transferrin family substrate-binding protein [Rhodococcus triatomae]|uniref:Phosphonate transport system substrate-binding protein n=1 Tax=Rhodococcus triatomae TaxID=300028 RepID=A0A1G8CQQ8_9NOCA|nr:PhnD/SsuA/transferrin family substrate-binding protein [Rhodococcus triatomae]QNG18604.1 PhnD/SsuA/transferrin family substrate-binding protein [Rhodococcus triatomae]QNG21727.1 PhnD/SsuA/transferrin family substrate-binding protein [Rhodococcus triatomae]SDH47240.1 phosphonate transport system substrate-binding protein [Rhodococcus triatomae]